MFSQLFPKTTFTTYPNGLLAAPETKEVLDILRRFRLVDQFENVKNYQTYYVKTGETPDMLASRFYGSSEWYWLIMVFNEMVDPFRDWPRAGLDTNNNNAAYTEDAISFLPSQGDLYPFSVGDVIARCDSAGNVDTVNPFSAEITQVKRDLFTIYYDNQNMEGVKLAEGDYFAINTNGTLSKVHEVKLVRTPLTTISKFETEDGRELSPYTFRSGIGTSNERVLDPTDTSSASNLTTTLIYTYINNPESTLSEYFRSIEYANEYAYDQKRRIKIFPDSRKNEVYLAAAELLAKVPSVGRTSRITTANTNNLSLV